MIKKPVSELYTKYRFNGIPLHGAQFQLFHSSSYFTHLADLVERGHEVDVTDDSEGREHVHGQHDVQNEGALTALGIRKGIRRKLLVR